MEGMSRGEGVPLTSSCLAGRVGSGYHSTVSSAAARVPACRSHMCPPESRSAPADASPDDRDVPRYRPDERFWPYPDVPEEPDVEELASIDPDLRDALFGPQDRPFSITIVFPRFEARISTSRSHWRGNPPSTGKWAWDRSSGYERGSCRRTSCRCASCSKSSVATTGARS